MAADDILELRLTGNATQLHRVIQDTQRRVDKAARDMTAAARRAEQQNAAIMEAGRRVTSSVMTSTERYRRELSSLRRMLRESAISQETFNRAQERARQQLPSVQKAQEAHNRALEMARKVRESMRTPEQNHSRLVLQLNNLLRTSKITQEEYNHAVAESAKTLPKAIAAAQALEQEQARLNQIMEEGRRITIQHMSATDAYRASKSRLDEMLREGAITTKVYDQELKDLKRTLPGVQAAEQQTAKAEELLNQQMERGRQLVQSLLSPEQRYAQAQQELNQLLAVGAINHAQYLQLLARESQLLPGVAQAQARFDAMMERGVQISQSLLSPLQRYERAQYELNQLLAAGAITLSEYLQQLARESQQLPSVQQAQQRYNDAVERARQLNQQLMPHLQQYRARQAELNDLLNRGLLSQRLYSRGMRQLRLEFDRTVPAIQKVSTSLRQLSGSMRMGGMMSSLFVTAPLTAFATSGTHSLMQFDKAMTNSLSIAENVTPALRKEMETLALTLSEKTAHSAIELAEAYYELISAGMDAQASMKSLHTVSKFAIAGEMNLESSVKQLAKATAAMGLSGHNAEETAAGMARTANVLVQAANMTTGSIEDMTQALVNAAAPQARLLNMELEDTVAVLMHYIQVGESAATSSEHFAIGMRLLGEAAFKHKNFWKAQGLELYEANGQMRKFTDVLRDMQKVYSKLSPQGRQPFLESLGFQALQQRALNPLLADKEAPAKIDEWAKKLKNLNALNEVYDRQMQSLSNQFKVFRNMVQNASMEVASILMPYLTKLVAGAKVLISYWKGLSSQGKTFAVALGAVASAVGPVLIAIGMIGTVAAGAVTAIGTVVTAVLTIGAPVAVVIGAVALLAGAIAAASIGIIAYSVAISYWPEQTEKVMKVLERMFNAFLGFMDSLFDAVFTEKMVSSFMKGAKEVLLQAIPFAKSLHDLLAGKDGAEDAAIDWAKQFQAGLDRAAGRMNLGNALANIIKEELGADVSFDGIKKKIDDALDLSNAQAKAKEEAEKMQKEMEKALKGVGAETEEAGGRFSSLTEKIREVNERFKEQIALEQEQARIGYKAVEKMTSAERELMKLELDRAKERQDIIDRYRKEGLGPENEEVKRAIANLEAQTEEQMKLARAQAATLSQLERQKKQAEELENLTKRYESPAQKFAREAKDLKKVFDAGRITAKQFAKEMSKLRGEMMKEIKVDFQIHGVEGVEAGTAEAAAAIENFIAAQEQAKRGIDLSTGELKPPVPASPSASSARQVARQGRRATVRLPVAARAVPQPVQRAPTGKGVPARAVRRTPARAPATPRMTPADRRAAELARREKRFWKRNAEKQLAKNDPNAYAQKKYEETLAFTGRMARAASMRERGAADREAYRVGAAAPEKEGTDKLLTPLERIASATEKMAKSKPVKIESADL